MSRKLLAPILMLVVVASYLPPQSGYGMTAPAMESPAPLAVESPGQEPTVAQVAVPRPIAAVPLDSPAGPRGNPPFDRPFVPGRVLVKFRSGMEVGVASGKTIESVGVMQTLFAQQGVQRLERLFPPDLVQPSKTDAILVNAADLSRVYRLAVSDAADVLAVARAFAEDPAVEWAEPDYLAHAAWTPNDPRFAEQWGLAKIEAAAAWDVTRGSPAVAIAVIDTGVDFNHPDLAGKIWVNPGEIAGNGIDDDGNGKIDDVNGWDWVNNSNVPQDDIGHGTHVAGIAAAATNNGVGVAGACPNCRVMALKVLDAGGSGTYSDIAAGITYAADKGARVINLSLGGYADSQLLRDAVAYASQVAVVIAAAGNDNKQDRFYPAAYDNYVVAVAATDNNDQKAAFANYGDWVDLSAPGVSIWSALFDDAYGAWSGSSMAAPFVSGVAGLIRSQNPAWTVGAVQGHLLHKTDATDSQNPSYQGKLGVGRTNASSAVSTAAQLELSIFSYAINGTENGHPSSVSFFL